MLLNSCLITFNCELFTPVGPDAVLKQQNMTDTKCVNLTL